VRAPRPATVAGAPGVPLEAVDLEVHVGQLATQHAARRLVAAGSRPTELPVQLPAPVERHVVPLEEDAWSQATCQGREAREGE